MASSLSSLTGLIRKYRDLFYPYRKALWLGVFALLVTNALGLAIPLQIKQAVDGLQTLFSTGSHHPSASEWQRFFTHLWLIGGLATLVLIARVSSRMFLLGAGRRIEYDLRNRIFGHLLKMPTTYFAAHPPGEMMSRMTNDVDATKSITGGGIMLGVNTILAYVLTIPMMLYLNWKLAVVTFLFYPIVIFVMSRLSKAIRRGYLQVQEVLADISTVGQENLSGMTVIQSYARENQEQQRFDAICAQYFDTYTRLIHERIILFMVLAGLSGLSTWLVLLVGGWQVIDRQLDWGGFVAFTMYLEQLAWPTMALGWTISILQQGNAALQRIEDVLSTEPSIAPSSMESQHTASSGFRGELRIENLTFHYQNPYANPKHNANAAKRADTTHAHETSGNVEPIQPATSHDIAPTDTPKAPEPTLKDISLTIQSGETVAIVGPVGSGKSTLLRLFPHLYNIPANTVFLDGQDITRIDTGLLRSAIVFMPQVNFLFSTTIRHNIAFGQPDLLQAGTPASHGDSPAEASILEAAEVASVHLDVQGLPRQYQTLVGERGVMLSGGQRQRVALARSILMDSPVLILDDPFSNVDAETERNIVSALRARRVFRDRTTLIATHRFSLLSLCDRVVLMNEGRIVAVGTPEELLATQPLYQKLYRLQELRTTLGDWGLEPELNGKANDNGRDTDTDADEDALVDVGEEG